MASSSFIVCIHLLAYFHHYLSPSPQVIDEGAQITDIPVWFKGSLLNYAENALQWSDERVALYAASRSRLHMHLLQLSHR